MATGDHESPDCPPCPPDPAAVVSKVLGSPLFVIYTVASSVSMCVSAYHGYKKNGGSLGWGMWWAFWGATMPAGLVPAFALADGLGGSECRSSTLTSDLGDKEKVELLRAAAELRGGDSYLEECIDDEKWGSVLSELRNELRTAQGDNARVSAIENLAARVRKFARKEGSLQTNTLAPHLADRVEAYLSGGKS